MKRSHLRGALLAFLLLPATACSFIFVDGPPKVAQNDYGQLEYFSCSEGNGWPIVDVAFAGLSLLGAASTAGVEGGESAAAINLVWAGIYGASAWTGFNKVSQCQFAKGQWMRASRQQGQGNDSGLTPVLLPSSVLPDAHRSPVLKEPGQN